MNSETQKGTMAFGKEDTKFFYALTPERILDAVEAFGFKCTGRCLALNSMENRVYEVEIELEEEKPKNRSERFRIVKFYRPGRWTREQILEEHRFLLDLAQYDIPAVAPLIFGDGETLLSVRDTNIWCAVFPKVGGQSPCELDEEVIPQVGRLLARMHNVGKTADAPHRLQITPETYGLRNLDYLLSEGVLPENIESRYESVINEVVDLTSPWFEQAEVQRIHGDAHLGNLLYGEQGFYWVDFDDMLRGPCVQDLWLIVGGRDEEGQKKLDLLIESYELMREFDKRSLRLIEPLRFFRVVHFNAWISKRWTDPAFPRTFVEFGSERYWHEQICFLEEQRDLIQQSTHWYYG